MCKIDSVGCEYEPESNKLISVNVQFGKANIRIMNHGTIKKNFLELFLTILSGKKCTVFPLRNPRQAVIMVDEEGLLTVLPDIFDLSSSNLFSSTVYKILTLTVTNLR